MTDQTKKDHTGRYTREGLIGVVLRRVFRVCRYLNLEVPSVINQSLGHYEKCRLALNVLRDEAEQITIRRQGTLWTCHAWDRYITEHLFVNGGYQVAEIQSLLSWMKHHRRIARDRDVIVNVGANIGTTSIPFAQQTECQVVAIEPMKANFELLRRNVRQNGLDDRIVCVRAAIDFRAGSVKMAMPQANCGGASIQQTGTAPRCADGDRVGEVVEVPADTLTHILEKHEISPNRVAFVWSDTEGSECRVIETGRQSWLAGVPLYVEVYPQALRLQNGVDEFLRRVNQFFSRFIERPDLIREGIAARRRPISDLAHLIERLDENHGNGGVYISDVLLLPA